MISTAATKEITTKQRYVLRDVARLRQEIENLTDYLDLLEARAKNLGKRRYSTADVKKRLGLK